MLDEYMYILIEHMHIYQFCRRSPPAGCARASPASPPDASIFATRSSRIASPWCTLRAPNPPQLPRRVGRSTMSGGALVAWRGAMTRAR